MTTQDSFRDIWRVKVKKRKIVTDMKDCPIFGKHAPKIIKKIDRVFETEVNHFYFA